MGFSFPQGYDLEDVPVNAFSRMAFGDDELIEFPYTNLVVKGGIRYAKHEFPHSPGAEIEKLGRHPYVIAVKGLFHYLPGSELDKQYPEIYPTKLRKLRELFEKEITGKFVCPTIGTIRAVCTSWTQSFDAKTPTGEDVDLEFTEDQDGDAFEDESANFGPTAMVDAMEDLLAAAALLESKKMVSVMQAINDAVTAVQGAIGQADALNQVVAGKIAAVAQLCSYADSELEELQNPENYAVHEALKNLWAASNSLAANINQTAIEPKTWRTSKTMSAIQIATTLYGTSEKVNLLLEMNSFPDPLAVGAGTLVIYLP